MPDRQRVTLTVEIDLDAVPGVMHTPRSAETIIQNLLNQSVGHYNPVVSL